MVKYTIFMMSVKNFTRYLNSHRKKYNDVFLHGHQLAQLMIDFGLGVSTREVYEIKAIDSDYFSEN